MSEVAPVVEGPAFELRIEYQQGTPDPARVFRAMAGLLDSVEEIETHLARSISVVIQPSLVLQEIRASSLITVVRTLIRSLDPQHELQFGWELPVVRYLEAGVMRVIAFLEERDSVDDLAGVEAVQGDLQNFAEQTGASAFPHYPPVPLPDLLHDMRKIGNSVAGLLPTDTVSVKGYGASLPLNTKFRLPPERIDDLLTTDVIRDHPIAELIVKKPDYLGNSMWQFRYQDQVIDVKLLDRDWLRSFQAGGIDLRPGDGLRAEMLVEAQFGRSGELVATHYTLLKVLNVVQNAADSQGNLDLT